MEGVLVGEVRNGIVLYCEFVSLAVVATGTRVVKIKEISLYARDVSSAPEHVMI